MDDGALHEHLLVKWEKVEQIETKNGIFALRFADQTVKLIVIALKHADISFEFFNVFFLHRQESCILVYLTFITKVG